MDELYLIDGRPKFLQALPHSFQHVLTMFVTNLVPIATISAAARPAIPDEAVLWMIQAALIASGIATILQSTPVWKIGSGLPIFMGLSFTFIVPLSAIAAKHGYGTVIGTVLVGGVFEGILGMTVKYWKGLIAPIVSALVVTGIGIALLPTAARRFGGGNGGDFGSVPNLVIGGVTIMAGLTWMVWVKGTKRQLSILAGLAAGYITALFLGRVDLRGVLDGAWFALPRFLPFRPAFRIDAIVSVMIVYLVSASETLGDGSAVAGGILHRSMTKEEMTGALTVDGFGSALSALFGATPVTSYSENVGLSIMTGVVSRKVMRIGGAILIVTGFFPIVGRIAGTIPDAAIGGVLLMVMGQILVSGIAMIADAGFTMRNRMIAAISLSMSIGFTASSEKGIWVNFPTMIQTIFSQNVIAFIFVTALLLNLILPKDD